MRGANSSILYIYYLLLISYILYKEVVVIRFLIVILSYCHAVTLLFCSFLSYEARHKEQFLSRLAAEDSERVFVGNDGTVERRVHGTVGLAVDVDVFAESDDGVAWIGNLVQHLGVLEEGVMIFFVAGDETSEEVAHSHASLLASHQLQVHARLRVWVEAHELRFVTLEALVQHLVCDPRFARLGT